MTGSRRYKRQGGPSRRGFSLMEALVVIALLAMVAVISLPLARGPGPHQVLEATATTISGRLRETRLAAISANAPQTFIIDTGARTLGPAGTLRPIVLTAGIEVDVTAASGAGERAVFVFHPDGSASGGRIVLRPARPMAGARSAVIVIDGLSGRISTRTEG